MDVILVLNKLFGHCDCHLHEISLLIYDFPRHPCDRSLNDSSVSTDNDYAIRCILVSVNSPHVVNYIPVPFINPESFTGFPPTVTVPG